MRVKSDLVKLIETLSEPLRIAVGFLTIVPFSRDFNSDRAAKWAVAVFPIAGLMIGLVLFGLASLMNGLPRITTSIVLVVSLAILSGGIHLDGLSDTVDGLLAGHKKGDTDRTLEVMRDPLVGFFGLLAVLLLFLLKIAFLQCIPPRQLGSAVLVLPILGRYPLLILITFLDYVRPQGAGSTFSQTGISQFAAGSLITFFIAIPLGAAALLSLSAVIAWSVIIALSFQRRIGGYTGDILGAAVETSEVVALIAMTAFYII